MLGIGLLLYHVRGFTSRDVGSGGAVLDDDAPALWGGALAVDALTHCGIASSPGSHPRMLVARALPLPLAWTSCKQSVRKVEKPGTTSCSHIFLNDMIILCFHLFYAK